MFTLNRSLLFINSEFVVCMFENIEFFFKVEFFLGKSDLVFLDNWSFLCFLPGLCAFIMCKVRLIKNILPYYRLHCLTFPHLWFYGTSHRNATFVQDGLLCKL